MENYLAKGRPTGARVLMMGGGTASGKSTIVRQGHVDLGDNLVVDSDELKGEIPEYNALIKQGDKEAASYGHEESSHLAKRIASEALRGNMPVLMDGTGDSEFEKLAKKVDGWRRDGAKEVVAEYVTVSTEVAVQRALERAEKTGRYVDPDVVRDIHADVSRVVPRAIESQIFDRIRLWDTEGKEPKLIMESRRGGQTIVHDKEGWERFLTKGRAGTENVQNSKPLNSDEITEIMMEVALKRPPRLQTPEANALRAKLQKSYDNLPPGMIWDIPFDYPMPDSAKEAE